MSDPRSPTDRLETAAPLKRCTGTAKGALLIGSFLVACGTPERGDHQPPESGEPVDVQAEPTSAGAAPSDGFQGSIILLSPAAFPELPAAVSAALVDLGCTIPQAYGVPGPPHNVIQGSFRTTGHEDWAVLCSRGTRSSILVFWSGSDRDVEEIGEADNAAFTQVVAPDTVGFSRFIFALNPPASRRAVEDDESDPPLVLSHSGIEDAFVEKASVVHYYYHGRWLRLQGAD